MRLQVQADGTLQPVDFFAPFDAASLDNFDADFASGGITGLPDAYFGTPTLPHLGVVVGKSGYVYLLNRDSLGGFDQGPGGTEAVVQRLGPRGGVWSRPGIWPGDGGWIYIPTSSGSTGGGLLDVYKYGLDGSGQPSLSLQASSSDVFGWGSGAPVITSDGTTSGSALVWIIWTTNRTGAGGQLRAYDPAAGQRPPGASVERTNRDRLELQHPGRRRRATVRRHARREGPRVRIADHAGAERLGPHASRPRRSATAARARSR